MKKKEDVSKISDEKFEVQLIGNGIIENIVKEGATLEKLDVLKLIKANKSVCPSQKHCILVTSNSFASITKEARKLSAGKKGKQPKETIAKAVVVNNLGHQLIGNFYVNVNKPNIKTKIFSERSKALIWLRKQLSSINKKEGLNLSFF
jgi:hypothetical protein